MSYTNAGIVSTTSLESSHVDSSLNASRKWGAHSPLSTVECFLYYSLIISDN